MPIVGNTDGHATLEAVKGRPAVLSDGNGDISLRVAQGSSENNHTSGQLAQQRILF